MDIETICVVPNSGGKPQPQPKTSTRPPAPSNKEGGKLNPTRWRQLPDPSSMRALLPNRLLVQGLRPSRGQLTKSEMAPNSRKHATYHHLRR